MWGAHSHTSPRTEGIRSCPPPFTIKLLVTHMKRSTHQTSAIKIKDWSVAMVVDTGHCRPQSSLADGGHVFVYRETSLDDPNSPAQSLTRALCCGVAKPVSVHMAFYSCTSKAVVDELSVTAGVDHVTVHELLFTQSQDISSSSRPSTLERLRW